MMIKSINNGTYYDTYHVVYQIVKLLLKQAEGRLQINAKMQDGATAFLLAVMSGHEKVVRLLLPAQKEKGQTDGAVASGGSDSRDSTISQALDIA
eukprot:COSAG05_NODE_450_length_9731_cov_41.140201_5_plen_94_part_01